jgi:hypothetical protein
MLLSKLSPRGVQGVYRATNGLFGGTMRVCKNVLLIDLWARTSHEPLRHGCCMYCTCFLPYGRRMEKFIVDIVDRVKMERMDIEVGVDSSL